MVLTYLETVLVFKWIEYIHLADTYSICTGFSVVIFIHTLTCFLCSSSAAICAASSLQIDASFSCWRPSRHCWLWYNSWCSLLASALICASWWCRCVEWLFAASRLASKWKEIKWDTVSYVQEILFSEMTFILFNTVIIICGTMNTVVCTYITHRESPHYAIFSGFLPLSPS